MKDDKSGTAKATASIFWLPKTAKKPEKSPKEIVDVIDMIEPISVKVKPQSTKTSRNQTTKESKPSKSTSPATDEIIEILDDNKETKENKENKENKSKKPINPFFLTKEEKTQLQALEREQRIQEDILRTKAENDKMLSKGGTTMISPAISSFFTARNPSTKVSNANSAQMIDLNLDPKEYDMKLLSLFAIKSKNSLIFQELITNDSKICLPDRSISLFSTSDSYTYVDLCSDESFYPIIPMKMSSLQPENCLDSFTMRSDWTLAMLSFQQQFRSQLHSHLNSSSSIVDLTQSIVSLNQQLPSFSDLTSSLKDSSNNQSNQSNQSNYGVIYHHMKDWLQGWISKINASNEKAALLAVDSTKKPCSSRLKKKNEMTKKCVKNVKNNKKKYDDEEDEVEEFEDEEDEEEYGEVDEEYDEEYDDFYDSEDTNDDDVGENGSSRRHRRQDNSNRLPNVYILLGHSGSGKTQLIYDIANQLGINIIEFNASHTRNGSEIKRLITEAGQSHRMINKTIEQTQNNPIVLLDSPSNLSNPMNSAQSTKKINPTNPSNSTIKTSTQASFSLLLFDEVDIICPKEDVQFYETIRSIARQSKCPIVLTGETLPLALENLSAIKNQLIPLTPQEFTENIWKKQNLSDKTSYIAPEINNNLKEIIDDLGFCCQYNVRSALRTLDLFGSMLPILPETNVSPSKEQLNQLSKQHIFYSFLYQQHYDNILFDTLIESYVQQISPAESSLTLSNTCDNSKYYYHPLVTSLEPRVCYTQQTNRLTIHGKHFLQRVYPLSSPQSQPQSQQLCSIEIRFPRLQLTFPAEIISDSELWVTIPSESMANLINSTTSFQPALIDFPIISLCIPTINPLVSLKISNEIYGNASSWCMFVDNYEQSLLLPYKLFALTTNPCGRVYSFVKNLRQIKVNANNDEQAVISTQPQPTKPPRGRKLKRKSSLSLVSEDSFPQETSKQELSEKQVDMTSDNDDFSSIQGEDNNANNNTLVNTSMTSIATNSTGSNKKRRYFESDDDEFDEDNEGMKGFNPQDLSFTTIQSNPHNNTIEFLNSSIESIDKQDLELRQPMNQPVEGEKEELKSTCDLLQLCDEIEITRQHPAYEYTRHLPWGQEYLDNESQPMLFPMKVSSNFSHEINEMKGIDETLKFFDQQVQLLSDLSDYDLYQARWQIIQQIEEDDEEDNQEQLSSSDSIAYFYNQFESNVSYLLNTMSLRLTSTLTSLSIPTSQLIVQPSSQLSASITFTPSIKYLSRQQIYQQRKQQIKQMFVAFSYGNNNQQLVSELIPWITTLGYLSLEADERIQAFEALNMSKSRRSKRQSESFEKKPSIRFEYLQQMLSFLETEIDYLMTFKYNIRENPKHLLDNNSKDDSMNNSFVVNCEEECELFIEETKTTKIDQVTDESNKTNDTIVITIDDDPPSNNYKQNKNNIIKSNSKNNKNNKSDLNNYIEICLDEDAEDDSSVKEEEEDDDDQSYDLNQEFDEVMEEMDQESEFEDSSDDEI